MVKEIFILASRKTVIRRELESRINETGVFSTWNVAHLYLGMDRAIPYTAPYPASIGYHPGRNALIAIATDSTGQITGGQFIHLDRDGHKLNMPAGWM